MDKSSKIFIAGSGGLVGSAIVRYLKKEGYANLLTPRRDSLDLMDSNAVKAFFEKENPEYVFDAAAKVGGIIGNSRYPADFLYENLQIQNNIIYNSHIFKVKKLVFLGSSCIYPKLAPQPIKEEDLLTGPLEFTNEAYAIAKIAGLMLCNKYWEEYGDHFISVMPTNIYGTFDNFHPENSHVIPALIRRFVQAKEENVKEVVVWGTGNPKREFLFSDDLAESIVFMMNKFDQKGFLNVGTGVDITIKELSQIMKEVTGFQGDVVFDSSKPDGTPRKLLDVSKINELGWNAKTSFKDGLKISVEWYKENVLSKER